MAWRLIDLASTLAARGFNDWRTRLSLGAVIIVVCTNPAFALPGLKVGADGHFLVQDDGNDTPFVWIGDTAWYVSKLGPSEVDHYLQNRARKKFTVIQAMAVRNQGGLENFAGEHPFSSMNPVRFNEPYWQHMDYIVNKAEQLGLYVAIFAMWGQQADDLFPKPTANNYEYGKLLGERYRDRNHVLWAVSGEYEKIKDEWRDDSNISAEQKALLLRIAEGLEDGHGGHNLMTVHPIFTSAKDFHDESWLDFNMQQTWGHVAPDIDRIREDYRRTPTKPVLNGEPGYENREDGWPCPAWHLRVEGYLSMFSGAFGFTYGAHHIWQMDSEWKKSLDYEGAFDMQHLGALIKSRPILSRIPDQSIITSSIGSRDKSSPAARAATRASDGSYVFVYSSQGGAFSVDMSKTSGKHAQAWWYNPKDGKCYDNNGNETESPFGTFETDGTRDFDPPGSPAEDNDWVLVLDDASKGFPPPGTPAEPAKVVAPAAPNASPATCRVLEYLYSLTSRRDKRVVSGQFLDHGTQASLDEVAEVHDKTGKWVGMVGGDYYGRDDPPNVTDASWSLDANWKETNPILIDYWKRGGLVTLCLHPFNPQSGKSAWIKRSGDTINLTDVLTPGRPGHDTWMRQLDLIAEGLQDLEDEGVVVLFRPFHEMSGNWFWWGNMNTKDEFVNLWKHMFDYFTYTKGLDNLLWYYCPSSKGGALDFYPGDEYVDLVGVDYYGRKNSGPNLADIRRNGYADLTATGKPFGLGEFGPYHGINFLENPPKDYDYGKFIRDIKEHLPLCTSFLIWHQYYGLQFQKNAQQCLNDPWTVNRADLPCFRQPQPEDLKR